MSLSNLTTNFCPDCGCLLDVPGYVEYITCNLCGYSCQAAEFEKTTIVTRSVNPDHLAKSAVVASGTEKKNTNALINEECMKCHAKQVSFTTMQLRSADEGQTVFYNCLKCGHKWNVNA
eukprot:EC715979.1.p2 GENE.EC715979.1~~EC715979.1.p2  ORF type:complete len:119 (+),score=14.72 EC715979.1:52-408(+)